MPPVGRKRRIVADEAEDGPDESSEEEQARSTQRRRRQVEDSDSDDDPHSRTRADRDDMEAEEEGDDSMDQLVKKLVRYALACEYSRTAIKRDGIREKALGKQKASFKTLFDSAQKELKEKFGMEMVELPLKEKVTLKDRRAAQKTNTLLSSNAWVLTSILPAEYRIPSIIAPSLVPTTSYEASYIALYTMIISLISLSGGTLSNDRLDRYLKRLNADVNMPMDKTEASLQRMIKQGYLVKIVERQGDDMITDWMVGPRGKIEVGNKGVRGLVMEVYGDNAPDDLVDKIKSSLGLVSVEANAEDEESVGEQQINGEESSERRGPGRPRRRAIEGEDD